MDQDRKAPASKRGLWEASAAAAGAIAFGVAFSLPVLRHLNDRGGVFDWDLFTSLAWVPYLTVVRFHQLPLWNPYLCGGIPTLGDPEVRIVTPFFLLHLLVGPIAAINLEIPLHLAVGWAGAYLLVRAMGLSALAAIACATTFSSSSWFYLHIAVGHTTFLAYTYMPWAVALAWLSVDRRKLVYAAGSGAILALTFFEGAFYPTFHAALLIGLLMIGVAIARRDPRPLLVLAAVTIFASGFGAIKLMPALAFAGRHPRPSGGEQAAASQLLSALFSRSQDIQHYVGGVGFFEWGAYVSAFFAALAIVGAVVSVRRSWPWLFALVTFFLLAMGSYGIYSPWSLLHDLPLLSWSRLTPRFLIPVTLCVAVMTGYGAEFFHRRSQFWNAVAWVLIATGSLDAWLVVTPNLAFARRMEERQIVDAPWDFRQFRSPNSPDFTQHMWSIIQGNHGAATCYRYMPISAAVVGENEPSYRGEQYLLNSGQVELLEWSPNLLRYKVETRIGNVMVVNQNYDPAWRLTAGQGNVISLHGLLAVRLPAGRQRLELAYKGRFVAAGALVSFVTLLVSVAMVNSGRSGPASAKNVTDGEGVFPA